MHLPLPSAFRECSVYFLVDISKILFKIHLLSCVFTVVGGSAASIAAALRIHRRRGQRRFHRRCRSRVTTPRSFTTLFSSSKSSPTFSSALSLPPRRFSRCRTANCRPHRNSRPLRRRHCGQIGILDYCVRERKWPC